MGELGRHEVLGAFAPVIQLARVSSSYRICLEFGVKKLIFSNRIEWIASKLTTNARTW